MRGHLLVAGLAAMGMLGGCGGGGGGGGPGGGTSGVRPTPSESFFVAGETAEETGAITQSGSAASRTDSTVTLTFDAGGAPDILRIKTSSGADLGSWSGRQIICTGPNCILDDSDLGINDFGTLANPLHPASGWSYQTFGYWLQDRNHQPVAFSTGSPTSATAVLEFAEATYTGKSGGLYITGDVVTEHRADITAVVDFGSRSIDFSTTNTQMGVLGGTSMAGAPQLNMQGTLSITDGYSFSGTLNAVELEAAATGRFYGPNAEEIGGVFQCSTCPSGTSLSGAFGGQR